jgi:septum formation inhibitor MinC
MDTPFTDDDALFDPAELTGNELTGGLTGGLAGGKQQAIPAAKDEPERDTRNSIVAARGTSDGLVLRIDGRVDSADLRQALRDFLESRRSFLCGHDVAFEWVGKKGEDAVVLELTEILRDEFEISVRNSRLKPVVTKTAEAAPIPLQAPISLQTEVQPGHGLAVVGGGRTGTGPRSATTGSHDRGGASEKGMSLFDGMEGFDTRGSSSAGNSMLWDDPDARIIYGTLRSGQKIESEHSVVVFGDVNSGAEVIAGGDVVVLGTLRGIAHAGAYDESGGGRVIFSLNLQPTQLRIGLVISRGNAGERADASRGATSEVARVENNLIVVEPYQSRTVWVRRRE